MRLLPSSSIAAVVFLIGACSFINAPDDVRPQASGGSESSQGGSGATAGKGNNLGGDGQTMANAGSDQGGDGTVIGNGGDVGLGGEGPGVDPGPGVNPTTGILLLASQDDQKVRYVSVLNGRTGKEQHVPAEEERLFQVAGHAGRRQGWPFGAIGRRHELRRVSYAPPGRWSVRSSPQFGYCDPDASPRRGPPTFEAA